MTWGRPAEAGPIGLVVRDYRQGRLHGVDPLVYISDSLIVLAPLVDLARNLSSPFKRCLRGSRAGLPHAMLDSLQGMLNREGMQ